MNGMSIGSKALQLAALPMLAIKHPETSFAR